MKESKLIEMQNKVGALTRVVQQLMGEISNLKDFTEKIYRKRYRAGPPLLFSFFIVYYYFLLCFVVLYCVFNVFLMFLLLFFHCFLLFF